ncbi:MAG: AraC family transcriptional regulator [Sinimarinibacterium sp.]|jgi:AraC-like DNA-binding protein
MKAEDLAKPAVPVVYGLLILQLAAARGVSRERMLEGFRLPPGLLDNADARLTLVQASQLLLRAVKLSGDPALGYEIGLNSGLTTHGFIGYGVMSHRTLREAIEFGQGFLKLRLPNLSLRLYTDNAQAVIEVTETVPQGSARVLIFDLFLVGIARMAQQLISAEAWNWIELWFDYPQPPYYERYRTRLPSVRFGMGANQLRFHAAILDLPLATANAVTAKLVQEQCARELAVLGFGEDFPGRVRALLADAAAGYPDLASAAERLTTSPRTLKRRLLQHGLRYSELLDEARRRDSIRLLDNPALSIEQIALQVGYSDPANFTRAFRKWTGTSPTGYRSAQH